MGNNTQSRKWSLVINNPLEAGLERRYPGNPAPLFSGLFLQGRRDCNNRDISHAYLPVLSLTHALLHHQGQVSNRSY